MYGAAKKAFRSAMTVILLLLPVEFCYFTFSVEPHQILPRQYINPQHSAVYSALQYNNPNIVVAVASLWSRLGMCTVYNRTPQPLVCGWHVTSVIMLFFFREGVWNHKTSFKPFLDKAEILHRKNFENFWAVFYVDMQYIVNWLFENVLKMASP